MKKNEIEEVVFNKENEYGITGLSINSILPDEKPVKIENVKEQKIISSEIQELIKNYKEPDLTFTISHLETAICKIPFVKKNKSDLPKLKLTVFNTTTETNENFLMYDCIGHLKKFGFEWSVNDKNLDFRYEIKIDNSYAKKLIKKFFLSRQTRTFLQIDESRI